MFEYGLCWALRMDLWVVLCLKLLVDCVKAGLELMVLGALVAWLHLIVVLA